MKRLLKLMLAVGVLSFAFITSAHAQATRTWVSGVGDDANPCSRTAPCKTFAGAISKTATQGEIDVLDPGGFGALTITKAITIDGGGQMAGVLVSGTNGITINAGATDTVVLRGIAFRGVGTGVDGVQILGAGNVVIDHCTFQGFIHNNIEVSLASSGYVLVQDSTIVGGDKGVVITATSGPGPVSALLKNVTVQGTRIALQTLRGHIDATHSTIQNNLGYGAQATVGSIGLENSIFSGNGIAIEAESGGQVNLSNVDMFNNTVGIGAGGGIVASALNNRQFNSTTPGAPNATMLTQ
ncbi:hypothetical protein [Rhodanobacter sp. C03]|uniref:hypothetical protein n=1 Tax=Rhodanobacter sp. C03 TaxID=1945858 RepID=UPI0009C5F6C2|nr:hypothetical protein [Rhodanobacter sp. C03]OOG55448.1 hypothetical protein B0E48_12405 [Rhodanobacter sp. C03]